MEQIMRTGQVLYVFSRGNPHKFMDSLQGWNEIMREVKVDLKMLAFSK